MADYLGMLRHMWAYVGMEGMCKNRKEFIIMYMNM